MVHWFNDGAKIQFPSTSLYEQYAFIYRVVKSMFESAKNIYIGGNKDKPIYYDEDNPNRPPIKSFNFKKMNLLVFISNFYSKNNTEEYLVTCFTKNQ